MTKGYKIMAVILLVLTTVAFALSIAALTTCINNNQKADIHDEVEEEQVTVALVWLPDLAVATTIDVKEYKQEGDYLIITSRDDYTFTIHKDHCFMWSERVTPKSLCPKCKHATYVGNETPFGTGTLYTVHCNTCDIEYYYYVED